MREYIKIFEENDDQERYHLNNEMDVEKNDGILNYDVIDEFDFENIITDLSIKHGVSEEQILDQVNKGIVKEMEEHGDDYNLCLQIALAHINELWDYYDRLDIMEMEGEEENDSEEEKKVEVELEVKSKEKIKKLEIEVCFEEKYKKLF